VGLENFADIGWSKIATGITKLQAQTRKSLRNTNVTISKLEFEQMQARLYKKPELKESDLHAQIIEVCKAKGWIYFHGSMAHRTYRTKGECDFVILANRGRVFFVEVKRKGGKLTTEQKGLAIWAEKLEHEIHLVHDLTEFLSKVAD
jgi:hypothetical protein